MPSAWSHVSAATGMVLRLSGYRLLALVLFAVGATAYAFTLPASYTGGVIGWVSLRQLTPELGFFAVALAALLSLVLTLNVYGLRASVRQRGKSLGLGAVVASILPAGLCCTTVVPSVLALLGASTPQIFGLSGRIQGIFALYAWAFLSASLLLLLFALHLVARNLQGSCPVPERRMSFDETHQG